MESAELGACPEKADNIAERVRLCIRGRVCVCESERARVSE